MYLRSIRARTGPGQGRNPKVRPQRPHVLESPGPPQQQGGCTVKLYALAIRVATLFSMGIYFR